MNWEQTQPQSPDEQDQARALSMTRTRPPRDIPGYELHEFLGSGAYDEVWVGADKNTGRRVAIKFYAQRASVAWSLIYREVEKLVVLSTDRYAVQLLDVGWDSDPPYYVMEYIEGGSLADWLRARGTPTVPEVVELFREIAIGLVHAHNRGVLHCDLKPENVLLDRDLHPRLADFGQSRLSNDQTPAIGTLYYMAPEQADLQAAPDARWDVYALGAILYCLLTGAPPHRANEELAAELEKAGNLTERLRIYRERITALGVPSGHVQRKGMDRTLVQILDRCLSVNPETRYANVQEVLDAIESRMRSRARRPLVTLGFVGPVLLILVMALFGGRGYYSAMRNTESLSQERAMERNRFAAQLAAEKVAGEISAYFDIADHEAQHEDLFQQLLPLLENPWLRKLNDPVMLDDEVEEVQRSFRDDERRLALSQYLEARLRAFLDATASNRPIPKFASIFVLDARGTMLAAAYDDDIVTDSIGRNWAHRAYFHGGPDELPPVTRPSASAQPLKRTHLSPVYKSTTTNRLKVAISTPIMHEQDDKEVCVGVLVMTVNHGDFEFFRSPEAAKPDRFAVLVDGRPGPDRGMILVHPFLSQLISEAGRTPIDAKALRLPPAVLDEELKADTARPYVDPVSQHPNGGAYAGNWLAAAAPVELWTGESGATQASGLVVLVQEDAHGVVAPVRILGRQLVREAISALGLVIAVIVAQWYFVSRFLL